jgi:hypothetical protein
MKNIACVSILVAILLAAATGKCRGEDLRAYQHGIDIVKRADGAYWLIWSSAGNPPKAPKKDWTHDIYYSPIDPRRPSITPAVLISNPEAQEPASAAISGDGHIMVTCEDGWNVENGVGQRWGLYDENLGPVKPYPHLIRDGGHSGHVAAVGNTFVIFWGEGWDDTVSGADGLGVGRRVLLDTFSSTGAHLNSFKVQVSDGTRDWWPVVAGSDDHAVLLWQRYVAGEKYSDLMYAVYDPRANRFVKGPSRLADRVKYYVYDVQYFSSIQRFLVAGAYYGGGGFAFLLDDGGEVVARHTALPPIVRESKPAKAEDAAFALAVYPRYPRGAFVLKLEPPDIELIETIEDDYD